MNTFQKTKEVIEALQDLDPKTISTKEVAKCRSELKAYMEELTNEICQAKKQNDFIQVLKVEGARQELEALYEKMDSKSVRDYERVKKIIMILVVIAVFAVMLLIGLMGSTILDKEGIGNIGFMPSQESAELVDAFPYLHMSFEEVVNEFGDGYEVVNHEGGLFVMYEDESIFYAFGFNSLEPNSKAVTIILHQGAEYRGARIGMALPVVIDMLGSPDSAGMNEMDGGYYIEYVRDDYTIEFFSDDEKSVVDAAVIRNINFK